jgi:hypothetical protein
MARRTDSIVILIEAKDSPAKPLVRTRAIEFRNWRFARGRFASLNMTAVVAPESFDRSHESGTDREAFAGPGEVVAAWRVCVVPQG